MSFIARRLLDLSAFLFLLGLGGYLGMPYLASAFVLGWMWRAVVR